MEKIIHELTLDFQDNESFQVIRTKQGDKSGGRKVVLTLTNNGHEVDLSGSDNTASLFASINGTITAANQSCEIVDNKVLIPILANLTEIAGTEHCEIRVKSDAGTVFTARFDILVGEAAVTDDMPHVLPTSNLVNDVESLQEDVLDLQANAVIWTDALKALGYTFSEYSMNQLNFSAAENPSIIGTNPSIDLPNFDYTKDGILVFKNDYIFIPNLSFAPLQGGGVTVTVGTTVTASDTVKIRCYIKPSYVESSTVKSIWTGTQAQYDALSSYDSNTLYVIEEVSS